LYVPSFTHSFSLYSFRDTIINSLLFFLFISNPILFVCLTSHVNTSSTSCNILPIITTSSAYAIISTHLSNIFPCVFTLDLKISISNTTFNSKGVRASPCVKPLFTLNSEDKCLPILTLHYISLFKVPHNLTNFLGKHSLCRSLYISFLHSVSYAA